MKTLETKKAPAAIGPYSQAKVVGNFVFASGQIPVDPATGEVAGDKIETQAEQSCKNVGAILEEAGLTFDNVVKTTCFLADMADFAAFNAVYEKYFTSKPARSCVAVKQLPKNVLCEVEAKRRPFRRRSGLLFCCVFLAGRYNRTIVTERVLNSYAIKLCRRQHG